MAKEDEGSLGEELMAKFKAGEISRRELLRLAAAAGGL